MIMEGAFKIDFSLTSVLQRFVLVLETSQKCFSAFFCFLTQKN